MCALRNPLKRCYGQGDLHFVTFSCYRRQAYLGSVLARNRFVKILDQVRLRHEFALVGYVVMPEHVHLLISEPRKGSPSKVLQVLKQKVSREDKKSPFWQRRFYDFNVWSEEKLKEKLNYMHKNPVERGLVAHPKDWPWSSWSFYEKEEDGLIGIDVRGC
ncbi:MAG TPA: transposase [Candidatus Acidoferrum sp.]|nr:transposase [Candidatus Acidoferrum sp.]